MKQAMVNISKDDEMSRHGSMLLQVHDEIVSVVDSEWKMWYRARLKQHMELSQPFEPFVALVADDTSGPNWKDCHK